MNLLDENFQSKEEKNHKAVKTVVIVAIIVVLLIIFAIMGYLSHIKNNILRTYIDGKELGAVSQILVFETDGSVYIPIKEIAQYVNYEAFNGEYNSSMPNEANKCYIKGENEIVNFELGSNKIYKLDLTRNTDNYEYINTERPVKAINGVLYANSETIAKAFNLSFQYDAKAKTVNIFTLPYLAKWYSKKVLDYNYANLNKVFANQKAILNNMLVVEHSNGLIGVVDIEGNTILEPKYQEIRYLPNMGKGVTLGTDFLVRNNNKVGLMSKDGKTKIQLIFDSIEILDIDKELYIVKRDGKYGVVDLRGQTIIHPEVEAIGYDISKFRENGIKNKYILAGNLIPVKKDKKWGLYDAKGKLVVDFEYDSLGYVATSNRNNALNLLVIPDYNVIVACKERKYILLSSVGQKLFEGAIADDIYMEINAGKKSYYINANNQIIDAEKYLDGIGLRKGVTEINIQQPEERTENQQQEQQNVQESNDNKQNSQDGQQDMQESNDNKQNSQDEQQDMQESENGGQNEEEQTRDEGEEEQESEDEEHEDEE